MEPLRTPWSRRWRAIRLAAGIRIADNNPSPARLAELLSDSQVAALRRRVRDGRPVDGPTEQGLEPQPVAAGQQPPRSKLSQSG